MDKNITTQESKEVKPSTEIDYLASLGMPFDPIQVKERAIKRLKGKKTGDNLKDIDKDETISSALALRELDNGVLMAIGFRNIYQSFSIQLSRDYQKQYKCSSAGSKSLAEISALNYCRILDLQRRITSYLSNGEITDMGVRYLAVMSKELDRAQRHYLTSMQALEMGLQQPLNVSIRTNTANIAGQQAIQQVGEQTNVKG